MIEFLRGGKRGGVAGELRVDRGLIAGSVVTDSWGCGGRVMVGR